MSMTSEIADRMASLAIDSQAQGMYSLAQCLCLLGTIAAMNDESIAEELLRPIAERCMEKVDPNSREKVN